MRSEALVDHHPWLRIAHPRWSDPLDPRYAARTGGRWNPPDSFPTLYLNEDLPTARRNLRLFIADWPYLPEDLHDAHGPVLITALLPRRQRVADACSDEGLAALGLPASYPLRGDGAIVEHSVCQPIGAEIHAVGLRGVRSRSARGEGGEGRELAWFPASLRSRAREGGRRGFREWFWSQRDARARRFLGAVGPGGGADR